MPEVDFSESPVFVRLRRLKIFFELALLTLLCLVVISLVREFVSRPFITSGDSMVPTFGADEYLVMDEITYRFHEPERGDVIIFRYPLDPSIFFIKRLIGLPGDTVSILNGIVSVRPADTSTFKILVEPYVEAKNRKIENSTVTLGVNEYFVLGDNRNASFDSRVWGPVPGRYIIGRPIARLYPLQRLRLTPGAFHYGFVVGTTTLSTPKK